MPRQPSRSLVDMWPVTRLKSSPQAPISPNAPIALPLREESAFEVDGMPLFGGTVKLSFDTDVHFLE